MVLMKYILLKNTDMFETELKSLHYINIITIHQESTKITKSNECDQGRE